MRVLLQRFVAVALCAASTITRVAGSPTPQPSVNDGGLFGRGDAEKVDVFAINRMVRNPKVRQTYVDCFLDKGPCSPEAQNIKRMVPDAIQNDCQHCTELQRKVIEKMMCYLDFHQPDIMKEIAAKFDPQGEFMKGFMGNILPNGHGQPLNPHSHQPQPQPNPPGPQSNPLPPQPNPLPPQPNPLPPQTNPLPPQSNPSPPQSNPLPPQSNPLPPQSNPSQSQPNLPRPQPNPSQPQQPQNQFQPNPSLPQQPKNQFQPNASPPQQPKNHSKTPQNQFQPQANQFQHQPHQPSQNKHQSQHKTSLLEVF